MKTPLEKLRANSPRTKKGSYLESSKKQDELIEKYGEEEGKEKHKKWLIEFNKEL